MQNKIEFEKKVKLIYYKEEVIEEFETNPPETINEAVVRIKKATGVEYDKLSIRRLLRNLQIEIKFEKKKLIDYKKEIKEEFNINPPKTIMEAVAKVKEITGVWYDKITIRGLLKKIQIKIKFEKKKKLIDYKREIKEEFKTNPPKTIMEAVAKMKKITGVEYNEISIRRLLRNLQIEIEFEKKKKLIDYKREIKEEFETNPPKTINEAVAGIKKITGVEYNKRRIRVFLRNLQIKIKSNKKLIDYEKEIMKEFEVNPPETINEAVIKVKEITGVEYNEIRIRRLLKNFQIEFNKKINNCEERECEGFIKYHR